MANQDLLDELDSLRALYDGSKDVTIKIPAPLLSVLENQSYTQATDPVEVKLCLDSQRKKPSYLQLHLWLEPEYPSAEADSYISPGFKLSSSCLSHCQLSQLCKRLDALFLEHCGGPVLIVCIEWLRIEAVDFLDFLSPGEDVSDARACVDFGDPYSQDEWEAEQGEHEMQTPSCALCCSESPGGELSCVAACEHKLCCACISMVVQVYNADKLWSRSPRCPLPNCEAAWPAEFAELMGPPDLWPTVSRRILKTSFQESVVFCPRCEDRGWDIPVLTNSTCTSEAKNEAATHGVSFCRCFHCSWSFCGICRSPHHPGEACLSDESRIVRMAKRRPPLPSHLAEQAAQAAMEFLETQKLRDRELRRKMQEGSRDFVAKRMSFLDAHSERILKGLKSIFAEPINISPAPLSKICVERFITMCEMGVELRPAFHGTDIVNHKSIFECGLLVPGVGNRLQVVHGAAHGSGVYTANIDAAWLSRGFCTAPSILVCAVLQTPHVRHVGDAMVVGISDNVVPLFQADSHCFLDGPTQPSPWRPPAPPQILASTATVKQTTIVSAKGAKAKQVGNTKPKAPESKKSAFKARLAKKSRQH